jgi:hypothetical protein
VVNIVAIKQPTFHTVAKDVGFPYPFAANPHLLITGRYSGSTDNNHKLVFRHVFSIRTGGDQRAPTKLPYGGAYLDHATTKY